VARKAFSDGKKRFPVGGPALPGIQTGRTDGTISGLKAGTLHDFRFKCLKTDDTCTDYSTVVGVLVH
jgi:hypothetical protein